LNEIQEWKAAIVGLVRGRQSGGEAAVQKAFIQIDETHLPSHRVEANAMNP